MPALMKGEVYADYESKLEFPCIVETKYDEIRCHVIVGDGVEFKAYSGKPLANMAHFAPLFRELSVITGYKEFDTGFEVNENFNDSYRWVRSTKGLPTDLRGAKVKFILFDLPEEGALEYHPNRIAKIEEVVATASLSAGEGRVSFMRPLREWADSAAEIMGIFGRERALGREGVMVKRPGHKYQRKRTSDWLKLKPKNGADGVVVELIEAVCGKDQPELGLRAGDKLGRIGSVRVRMPDGSEATPHGIPFDLGRKMMSHPDRYLGRWVEFFYMERDRQGGYRHPVFHRFREEK